MNFCNKYKSPLGYYNNDNQIDSYGVNHSGFSIRDELNYQFARKERENNLMEQLQNQGTKTLPQYTTDFWNKPAQNNYGFGSSNIEIPTNTSPETYTTESAWGYPNNSRSSFYKKMGRPYNINSLSEATHNKIDYSLYGDGFSKEFIDEMERNEEFKKILNEYIIPNEGGYNNDPDDSGGETNMGIAQNAHQNENVKNMTRERANAIYYKDYYKWNGLNKLPYSIRGFVVDYGLPTYPQHAIKTVHKVLDLPPDSDIIGPTTLKIFEHYTDEDYNDFLKKYKKEMKQHFNDIAQREPHKRKFLKGWLNRADRAHLAK